MPGTEFEPLFIFILVGISVGVGMFGASALLGPKRKSAVKDMPYESGVNPVGDARQRFDVRFYLVAIVFLLFDVELLYLYPWAVADWSVSAATVDSGQVGGVDAPSSVAAKTAVLAGIPPDARNFVLLDILVFIGILTAAYAYAWRKGVLQWR